MSDEPVDLRDKEGVVDPADLKKDDPKEPSLKTQEPPPPEKVDEVDASHYEVKISGNTAN